MSTTNGTKLIPVARTLRHRILCSSSDGGNGTHSQLLSFRLWTLSIMRFLVPGHLRTQDIERSAEIQLSRLEFTIIDSSWQKLMRCVTSVRRCLN